MSCHVHGLAGTRLLNPLRASSSTILCLECIFDDLQRDEAPKETLGKSLEELDDIVRSEPARAARLPGRLLWRTQLLQRTAELSFPKGPDGFARSCGAGRLLDIIASCVAEEEEELARASALECSNGGSAALLDAVLAVVTTACSPNGPALPMLQRILDRLRPSGAEALLQRVEASNTLLLAIVDTFAAESTSDLLRDAAASLLLRLAERSSDALCPHLGAAGSRLTSAFAEAKPGSGLATSLLALFSWCSLRSDVLLQCILGATSDTMVDRLHSLALGVRAHLAKRVGTIQAAAASLADELAKALPCEVASDWLNTCYLAEWLIETCQSGDGAAARAAAARALAHLADDGSLRERLHVLAADALLDACSDAANGSNALGASSPTDRVELLSTATTSLRKILSTPCSAPLATDRLCGLMRAARNASGHQAGKHGFTTFDCLIPLQLCVSARPVIATTSPSQRELFEHMAVVLARREESSSELLLCTVCVLLQAFSSAFHVPHSASHNDDVSAVRDTLYKCVQSLAERASESSSNVLELAIPAIVAAMWPELEAADTLRDWTTTSKWTLTVSRLCTLMRPLLAAHGMSPGCDAQADKKELRVVDADRYHAMLLVPALMVDTLPIHDDDDDDDELLQGLLFPLTKIVDECHVLLCSGLRSSQVSWVVASVTLQVLGKQGGDTGLLKQLIPRFSDVSPGSDCDIDRLPVRSVVFFAAAAARSTSTAAQTLGDMELIPQGTQECLCLSLSSALECRDDRGRRADEWALLRYGAINESSCDVRDAICWLLHCSNVDLGERLLRALAVQEGYAICACSDLADQPWSWLEDVIPSVEGILHLILSVMAQTNEDDIPGMLSLLWLVMERDADFHGEALASASTLSLVARLWERNGVSAACCARFTFDCIEFAPTVMFTVEGFNAIFSAVRAHFLSTSSIHGDSLAAHAVPHLIWRDDTYSLVQRFLVADWFRSSFSLVLNSTMNVQSPRASSHLPSAVAWASIAGVVISHGLESCTRGKRSSDGVIISSTDTFLVSLGLLETKMWSAALRQSCLLSRSFAAMTLAAIAMFSGQSSKFLPAANDLPDLVLQCARSLGTHSVEDCMESKCCQRLQPGDGALCLALVALLAAGKYPVELRTRLLAEALEPILRHLLWPNRSSAETQQAVPQTLSAPALLLLLLVLRSSQSRDLLCRRELWELASPLVAAAQRAPVASSGAADATRLLALRVGEALLALRSPGGEGGSGSRAGGADADLGCELDPLCRLCADNATWRAAEEEACAGQALSGGGTTQRLSLQGPTRDSDLSSRLVALHSRAVRRLCALASRIGAGRA